MKAASLAFHMCMYLGMKPGTVLFRDEIFKKWGPAPRSIDGQLSSAIGFGYIEAIKNPEDGTCYTAGPALLAMMETMK